MIHLPCGRVTQFCGPAGGGVGGGGGGGGGLLESPGVPNYSGHRGQTGMDHPLHQELRLHS